MGFRKDSERPSAEAPTFDGQRWEYRARNLAKVAGPMLEADFNEHGAAGWELVCVAKDYAVFKRPVAKGSSVAPELEAALTA